jgi:hypothetical protein
VLVREVASTSSTLNTILQSVGKEQVREGATATGTEMMGDIAANVTMTESSSFAKKGIGFRVSIPAYMMTTTMPWLEEQEEVKDGTLHPAATTLEVTIHGDGVHEGQLEKNYFLVEAGTGPVAG